MFAMGKKLIPKVESVSITGFAKSLRGEDGINTKQEEQINTSSLDELFQVIKQREQKDLSNVYIEEEIKEIFSLLKTKGKVPMSGLISSILEEWLKRNKNELEIILRSNNRFFD